MKPPKDRRRARRKTSIVLCVLVGVFFLYGGLTAIDTSARAGVVLAAIGVLFLAGAALLIRDDRRRST